jgi:hypothetical protein
MVRIYKTNKSTCRRKKSQHRSTKKFQAPFRQKAGLELFGRTIFAEPGFTIVKLEPHTYVCLCTLNFTPCVGRGRWKRFFCDMLFKAALNQNAENAIGRIGCITGPDGHREVVLASTTCILIRSRLGVAIKS